MTAELKAKIFEMLANKVPRKQIAKAVGLSKSRIGDLNAERLGKRWNRVRNEVGEAEPYSTAPDGLSVAEIAARMNLRPGYVQKILERGIRKLRVLLEAEPTNPTEAK
jgi:hypothetical protein